LIAIGGKPFIPKIEGIGHKDIFTFTTFADAEHLTIKIESAQRAVVIGGGLIGISVAEALINRGVHVTVVELKEWILNAILDPAASEIIKEEILKTGATIITGQSVTKVLGVTNHRERDVKGIVLTNGETVQCDLVIIAIGVRPRLEITAGTDLKTNMGIVVDQHMQTSVPNVYACGDVAEAYDYVLNEKRPLPLWPIARQGGRIAGCNMAGQKTVYTGETIMSALKYFDVPVISIGLINPKDDDKYAVLVHTDQPHRIYKKIVLRDDKIVGMIFVGDIEKAGIIHHLMKNHVNVQDFKDLLITENFGLVTLPPTIRRTMFFEGFR
jgi:NAD(P)H-nitrite reductase large subunit